MTSTLYSSGTVVTSASLNDFDKTAYATLSAVTGTNTITANGPASATSYTTGLRFFFNPQNTNTGAVTLNVSGLGAKSVTKYGSTALIAGDLVAGAEAFVYYDGTQFQLLNPRTVDLQAGVTGTLPIANGGTNASTASQALINLGATGRLIGVQTFTASGTYTPTSGTTRIWVKGQGAGGAGGGAAATAAGQVSFGSGGGAGGIGETFLTSGFSGATVTIGAGGTGVSGAAGNAGGASSFGAFLTLNGGAGGAAATAAGAGTGGTAAGGTASGGSIFNSNGQASCALSNSFAAGYVNGGQGATSLYGSGGSGNTGGTGAATGGAGLAAVSRSAGGGGAFAAAGGGAQAGGNGAGGIIIVYEYS